MNFSYFFAPPIFFFPTGHFSVAFLEHTTRDSCLACPLKCSIVANRKTSAVLSERNTEHTHTHAHTYNAYLLMLRLCDNEI